MVPWLQVTLFKGAVTKQIKKSHFLSLKIHIDSNEYSLTQVYIPVASHEIERGILLHFQLQVDILKPLFCQTPEFYLRIFFN